MAPCSESWYAREVMGKSSEYVSPVMKMMPEAFNSMSYPSSSSTPPR